MDLTSIIAAHLGARAATPSPDRPPAHMAKPQPGYVTRKVNGRWVIVPINGGNTDPALRPRIFVKPLKRG